jgi:hypothetical protein
MPTHVAGGSSSQVHVEAEPPVRRSLALSTRTRTIDLPFPKTISYSSRATSRSHTGWSEEERGIHSSRSISLRTTCTFSLVLFSTLSGTAGQTLAKVLQQVHTSITVSAPASITGAGPVTTCISLSMPAFAPIPTVASPRSSPPIAIAVSVTVASPPAWRAPSLQDFL